MEKKFGFKHYEKVVARETKGSKWCCDFYSHYDADRDYPFVCVGGYYEECVPYEGNAHLVNTTDPYEEPYIPKDGDLVYIELKNGEKYIFIKNKSEELSGKYISLNVCHGFLSNDCPKCCDDSDIIIIRPATDDETQLFFSRLHKIGKDWDAEKKEIVDWKWMPKRDDTYFFPQFDRNRGEFIADDVFWESMDEWFDKAHYERGWVFRTYKECQAMCDKLNKAIKNVK